MRQKKFRAWDKKEKVMGRVSVMNFDKGCFIEGNSPTPAEVHEFGITCGIPEGHFVYFADLELMQFAGLKDKNGKEIYEGDINQNGGVIICLSEYASLVWKYPNGDLHDILGDESHWCEIIGNIHQHPHLLNQTA